MRHVIVSVMETSLKAMSELTIEINFRMDAGDFLPTWKALRARVRQGDGRPGSPYVLGNYIHEYLGA